MKWKFQNALTADSGRVSVDGRKRYENGSVDADQLTAFFGKNESVYFWICVSVGLALSFERSSRASVTAT